MTFEEAARNASWNVRLGDTLVRTIALVALVLALVGLYAVTGHAVERWRREMAMRVALGARHADIAWLVVRRVLVQLAAGLGLGVVGAQLFDRFFNEPSNLTRMTDPGALFAVVVAIVALAAVACLPPIRRATRVDPIVALRTD
jgi:putative ABC transport system permease protein